MTQGHVRRGLVRHGQEPQPRRGPRGTVINLRRPGSDSGFQEQAGREARWEAGEAEGGLLPQSDGRVDEGEAPPAGHAHHHLETHLQTHLHAGSERSWVRACACARARTGWLGGPASGRV